MCFIMFIIRIFHVEFIFSISMDVLAMLHDMIQVDIDGHPPIPTDSKQFSSNLLFLAVFRFLNFRGHFEGLNEGFSRSSSSMIIAGYD
jgi:hypothetical protein